MHFKCKATHLHPIDTATQNLKNLFNQSNYHAKSYN